MPLHSYIEYTFEFSPLEPTTEILIAELSENGFDSFMETSEGLQAFVSENMWHNNILDDIFILSSGEFDIQYSFKKLENINWNSEWEKNFSPIIVDQQCTVRAPFHDKIDTMYDIVIEPKMSFGTGHHETTHMMIQYILETDFENKKVLDMGCGTGVLAILAAMKGAKSIDAVDIDQWCYLNTLENIKRNQCEKIVVKEGTISEIKGHQYDIILANINRNILLQDIRSYSEALLPHGKLFLSGFYDADLEKITDECEGNNLIFGSKKHKNDWISVFYKKK